MDFSEFSVWSFVLIIAVLLASLLVASTLKRFIPALEKSLIPSSVLGGIILLIVSTITYYAAGNYLFNLEAFTPTDRASAYNGMEVLELVTYHCLGIGFIAMGMRGSKKKFTKHRAGEIFDSGVITVNGYLIQAFVGIAITMVAASAIGVPGLIDAAGILLAFGFGQGTGQALNYGNIYERDNGFVGGGNFGLTIAALGFLVACIFGVIYMNVMRKKGKLVILKDEKKSELADYEDENEIPVVASMDKFTVQFAIVLIIYAISFIIMWGLSALLPSLTSVLFGFNFLIGTLLTVPAKAILNKLQEKKGIKRQIVNNFMMNRIGGWAFDLMIVAGVAAIQLPLLKDYWPVLLILAAAGTVVTFTYVFITSKLLFPGYYNEQFLAMFGMLTGTASTGVILLREIDCSYRTPASENLIYQSLPAIVFGFPLMFLAPYAAGGFIPCLITFFVVFAFFIVLNVLLFRRQIIQRFKRGRAVTADGQQGNSADHESEESAPDAQDK